MVTCLSNQKQLALAWIMYCDDNGDRMVSMSIWSQAGPPDPANIPWRVDRIIGQLNAPLPASITAGTSEAIIYQTQMGYKQPTPTLAGPLFKYAPNHDIVHCPADPRINLPISSGMTCYDSYSGMTYLNAEEFWFNPSNPGFLKRSQILHPAMRFLWAEGDDLRGDNLGSWGFNPGTAAKGFAIRRSGIHRRRFIWSRRCGIMRMGMRRTTNGRMPRPLPMPWTRPPTRMGRRSPARRSQMPTACMTCRGLASAIPRRRTREQVFFICAVRTHPEARGHFDQSLWTESARRKGWFLGAGCSIGGPPGLRAQLLAIGQAAAEPPA